MKYLILLLFLTGCTKSPKVGYCYQLPDDELLFFQVTKEFPTLGFETMFLNSNFRVNWPGLITKNALQSLKPVSCQDVKEYLNDYDQSQVKKK